MVHAFIEYGIILLIVQCTTVQYTTCNVHVEPFISPYTKKHFVVLINLYNVLQEK